MSKEGHDQINILLFQWSIRQLHEYIICCFQWHNVMQLSIVLYGWHGHVAKQHIQNALLYFQCNSGYLKMPWCNVYTLSILLGFHSSVIKDFSLLGLDAVFKVHEDFFMDSEALKMKVTRSLKMSGTTYSVTQCHILEHWNHLYWFLWF